MKMKFRVLYKNEKYVPQSKFLCFWLNFYDGGFELKEEFSSREEAEWFIRDLIRKRKSASASTYVVKEFEEEIPVELLKL